MVDYNNAKLNEIFNLTFPNLSLLKKPDLQKELQVGSRVRYLGCRKEQIDWGRNDDPYMCIVGRSYIVTDVEVHSQHTKIQLKGIVGKFNSVCFELE